MNLATENDLKCDAKERDSRGQEKVPQNLNNDFVILTSVGKRDKIDDPSDLRNTIVFPLIDRILAEMEKTILR